MDNSTLFGGLEPKGKIMFMSPSNKPCYIQIVNPNQHIYDFTIVGNNVSAYVMHLLYPMNHTDSKRIYPGSPYRIHKEYNITYLFLGSLTAKNASTQISWVQVDDAFPLRKIALATILLINAVILFVY